MWARDNIKCADGGINEKQPQPAFFRGLFRAIRTDLVETEPELKKTGVLLGISHDGEGVYCPRCGLQDFPLAVYKSFEEI